MTDREADRILRIMEAHETGWLNDVTLYAMFAATKAETLLRERERLAESLNERARYHLVRGDLETARALALFADELLLDQGRSPPPELEVELPESAAAL